MVPEVHSYFQIHVPAYQLDGHCVVLFVPDCFSPAQDDSCWHTADLKHWRGIPSTYWNQGYGYQQGYGPGYGGSDDSPHGYYGYGPGYYYSTYWNQGYGYQQGYGPGYGGSDDSPHGYYGYGPGYYYRWIRGMCSGGWPADVAVSGRLGAPRGAEPGLRLRRMSGQHFLVSLTQALVLDRRCLGMYNRVGTYGGAGS
ncbi:Kielin/Chordin-Like Protein [Manis pentadactyla]|nr:Kielin/Chordin-Like Protein [Manis pentadactyla]